MALDGEDDDLQVLLGEGVGLAVAFDWDSRSMALLLQAELRFLSLEPLTGLRV